MKRIVMAAAAIAALSTGFAGVANAAPHSHVVSQAITVNGRAPARCEITAPVTTVHLHHGQLVDSNGMVQTTVAGSIATALTSAGITAWCTGNHNGVVVSRTALVNQDNIPGTGIGTPDAAGFDNAVIFDVGVNIAGAVRADGHSPIDGSVDGAGNGPGVGVGAGDGGVSDFGPLTSGAAVTFVDDSADSGSGGSAVSTDSGSGISTDAGPTSDFGQDPATRIAAGRYTGSVTLTLTPHV